MLTCIYVLALNVSITEASQNSKDWNISFAKLGCQVLLVRTCY
jgi:hypothetical protein